MQAYPSRSDKKAEIAAECAALCSGPIDPIELNVTSAAGSVVPPKAMGTPKSAVTRMYCVSTLVVTKNTTAPTTTHLQWLACGFRSHFREVSDERACIFDLDVGAEVQNGHECW